MQGNYTPCSDEFKALLRKHYALKRASRHPIRTDQPTMEYSALFAQIRQELNISQQDMAIRMGCPRTMISKLENNGCIPTLPTLEKFCRTVGLPMYQFIRRLEYVRDGKMTLDGKKIERGNQCSTTA